MKNKKKLLPVILSVAIAIFVSWFIGICLTCNTKYPVKTMDWGYEVTINGEVFQDVEPFDIYKHLDRRLRYGDVVSMKTTLPDLGDIPFPVILFRSRYSAMDVYVDGDLIYTFGKDLYAKKKFIGKMYHFITLPLDYAGKEIEFKMIAGETDAFSSLQPPKIGSQPDVESQFVRDHRMIIATGMFLIIFGISFTLITMFFVVNVPDIVSFHVGSLFCINLGVWIMCYYNVFSPFIYTPYETQWEYLTMYLIVPFCYMLVYFAQKIEKKNLYMTAAGLSCFVTFSLYVLHFGFNIHLRETIMVYHITAVLGFGLISYFIVRNFVKKDISRSGMIQMSGLVAFAIAELIHLVIYIMDTNHIKNSYFASIITIDTGCLIFVLCQLANYMLFITQSYAQRLEHESLSHLAYADGLTNLANRAKADKVMEDLNHVNTDYCIISIDLNGLKIVNDDFGHPSGDRYIKDFAKVLTTTFSEEGLCARIGGDEFLVIISDSVGKDIDALIGRMTSALNVMNALYTEYHRSVATGYAYKHELPGASSHEVYLLADERMYAVKRRMHEELGIHNRL
ncbi:GGDEF domain-containing protein [Butyrivibrio sp. CB08]|uniref:GGDEF domain-containing protein n=1 Tax=Butyrivibrio sp. CB08 TaxID=2364879 RepID=UPI000EAA0876|nr:GGDEF domain-containing protein [Butyrivibrio sp. CB08]RKM55950.1 GGDEF domain-containing protein [Butyrivibrio sp. CB08]